MARVKIPDPLTRRHWVEQAMPAERALGIAKLYLAEDRAQEAVDFLAKAGAAEPLAALRERALAEGDLFLLRSVAAAQDAAPTAAEWERLAGSAASRGLERYASEARRQAERGEG